MRYFLTTSGKADRFEWWVISLIADVLLKISALIGFGLFLHKEDLLTRIGGFLLILLAVFFLWISIAVTCRRLRDRGRPLWCILLYLLPMVGWIWMVIECGFLPSAYTGPKRILVRRNVQTEQNPNINNPAPE